MKLIAPNKCLCPNCGLSELGFNVKVRGRSFFTCAFGCSTEAGDTLEVFTQEDQAEGFPNASDNDKLWLRRNYPEYINQAA